MSKFFGKVKTKLDLNGPTLEFITQPVSVATTGVGVGITGGPDVILSGIATVSFGSTGVAVNKGSIGYQWYESGLGKLVEGDKYVGTATTTLTIKNIITPTDNDKKYYLEADYVPGQPGARTGNALNEPLNSGIATVTVTPLLDIISQPTTTAALQNIDATFSISAQLTNNTTGGISYQWQIDEENITDGDITNDDTFVSITLEDQGLSSTQPSPYGQAVGEGEYFIPTDATNIVIDLASGPGGNGGTGLPPTDFGTPGKGGDGINQVFTPVSGSANVIPRKVRFIKGRRGGDGDVADTPDGLINGGSGSRAGGSSGTNSNFGASQGNHGGGGGGSTTFDIMYHNKETDVWSTVFAACLGGGGGGGAPGKLFQTPNNGQDGEDSNHTGVTGNPLNNQAAGGAGEGTAGSGGGGGGYSGDTGSGSNGGTGTDSRGGGGQDGRSSYRLDVLQNITGSLPGAQNTGGDGSTKLLFLQSSTDPLASTVTPGTISYTGSALSASSDSPFAFSGSVTFTGNQSNNIKIQGPANGGGTDLQFGTGAFTVECWIKTTAQAGWIMNNCYNGNGISIAVSQDADTGSGYVGKLEFCEKVNGSINGHTFSANPVNDGQWHHIAMSRPANGSATSCYVDGVYQGNHGGTTDHNGTEDCFFGRNKGTTNTAFVGQISNFRITNTHLYSGGNFTPSTTPLTDTGGAGEGAYLPVPSSSYTDGWGRLTYNSVSATSGSSETITVSGTQTDTLTIRSNLALTRRIRCVVSHTSEDIPALISNSVNFICQSTADTSNINIEIIGPSTGHSSQNFASLKEHNLNDGEYTFDMVPLSSTSTVLYYCFYSPDKDIDIEMDLYGGIGVNVTSINGTQNIGGQGGYSRIRFTLEKNTEYIITGLNDIIDAPFVYRKSTLIACVGGGGDAGIAMDADGGAGGGIGADGADGEVWGGGGGKGGDEMNLNTSGVYGSLFTTTDTTSLYYVTPPYPFDSIAQGTDGGQAITCPKGVYYAQEGLSPCQDITDPPLTHFRYGDSSEVANSALINRGYKPGYDMIQTAGAGDINGGGNGGNGATGGQGGTSNCGGGGGSGYTDGSVTVLDTQQGGSSANSKVVIRLAL